MNISKHFYREVLELKVKNEIVPRPGLKISFLDGESIDYELIENTEHPKAHIDESASVAFQVYSLESCILHL